MRSYFCRQKGVGWGCAAISALLYFSVCIPYPEIPSLSLPLLFFGLSPEPGTHKLHTEWFVAIPGEKRREKWIGGKFISKSGCTRLKCFFPNATRKKKKLFYITNSVLSVFSLFVRNLSVVVNWDNISSSSSFLFAIDSNGWGGGGWNPFGRHKGFWHYLFV